MKLRISKRSLVVGCIALVATAAPITSGASAAPPSNTDETTTETVDSSTALVVLTGEPVTTAQNVNRGNGSRVNLNGSATKSYRASLSAQRNSFRRWLKANAPNAQITGSFDIALNAVVVKLNGTSLDVIKRSTLVRTAQYEGYYHMLIDPPVDPDLALINAEQAWGADGEDGAGAGVKVAIIDSGIDQAHSCFNDMGDGDGPNNFTNGKVIVAKVFYNKAKAQGLTPEAIGSHGTHVAGTVACAFGTVATVGGASIPHTISGVAPAAQLGNYNVFPGAIENARSEDILNALEAAYADGMDVANMSLGGNAHGVQDLLTVAVDNLDRGGMVVAIASGNEGPGFSTVSSPGSAERALTAGASTVSHTVANTLTTSQGTALIVTGEFGALVSGPYSPLDTVEGAGPPGVQALAGVSTACSPIAVGNGVAVISRGVCDFTTKIRNVQTAGYAAAIVINRENGTLVMGGNGEPDQPTIPAVLIGLEDAAIVLGAAGGIVTFNAATYVQPYGTANEMGDFSSEGPTDVDRRIKPDLVAPGVNVLSSVPGGGFAFYNGTSMATPHLAGAAAVVLSQHPNWAPWMVRSAITNTANIGVLTPFYANPDRDPNLIGAGLLDLDAAVDAKVLLSSVSVSFGTAQSGAGTSATRAVSFDSGGVTVTAAVVDPYGSATFTATVNGSSLVITSSTPKGAAEGGSWATVELKIGGLVVAHMRVYVLVG